MRTVQIAPTAVGDVTEETLKLGPPRLLTFLQGVSDPAIRAQFAPLGWSEERLDEAWSLLTELKAANKFPATPVPDPVTEAIASCEEWQATGLVRARAMLQLTAPEQASFIFHDFVPGPGTAAVLNVATFLERRQALDDGTERKGTRKSDHDALAVIDDTGATKEVLKQLRGFVETVQTVAAPHPQHLVDADAKRSEVLRKIHAWITAWSEMARTVITRRDQMIKLGIAKRRSHKRKASVTPPAPPVIPAPPVAAPPAATPAIPQASSPSGQETSPESHAA